MITSDMPWFANGEVKLNRITNQNVKWSLKKKCLEVWIETLECCWYPWSMLHMPIGFIHFYFNLLCRSIGYILSQFNIPLHSGGRHILILWTCLLLMVSGGLRFEILGLVLADAVVQENTSQDSNSKCSSNSYCNSNGSICADGSLCIIWNMGERETWFRLIACKLILICVITSKQCAKFSFK